MPHHHFVCRNASTITPQVWHYILPTHTLTTQSEFYNKRKESDDVYRFFMCPARSEATNYYATIFTGFLCSTTLNKKNSQQNCRNGSEEANHQDSRLLLWYIHVYSSLCRLYSHSWSVMRFLQVSSESNFKNHFNKLNFNPIQCNDAEEIWACWITIDWIMRGIHMQLIKSQ